MSGLYWATGAIVVSIWFFGIGVLERLGRIERLLQRIKDNTFDLERVKRERGIHD